jgi:hypothetical protein
MPALFNYWNYSLWTRGQDAADYHRTSQKKKIRRGYSCQLSLITGTILVGLGNRMLLSQSPLEGDLLMMDYFNY